MISRNYFTFPFYIPRIYRLWSNWPEYLYNYLLRRSTPVEYRLRNGVRMVDGSGDLTGTLAVVFVRREYGDVKRFRTVVDIGANVGTFALYAAQAAPDAQIYCFEPEQLNFQLLQRNIDGNGLEQRISAFRCAVASTNDRRDLAVGASLLNSFHMQSEGAEIQSVDCLTLSDILAIHQLHTIDLLKINCEGAEYEILQACPSYVFDRIANIRLEYHNLDDNGRNGESLSRYLQTRGYKIERFTRYLNRSGFIWAGRVGLHAKLAVAAFFAEPLAAIL